MKSTDSPAPDSAPEIPDAAAPLSLTLDAFTKGLVQDLHDLRAGKITAHQARARTQLAREVLRSVHLQLEGQRFLAAQAKQLEPERPDAGAEA